jgi:hypothetical protein
MAERARWDSKGEEGLLLRKLFSDHTADNSTGADPSLCDPKYIRSVWEKHDIFKKFAARNFLPTYKRLGKEWMIEQQKTGARQRELCQKAASVSAKKIPRKKLSRKIWNRIVKKRKTTI